MEESSKKVKVKGVIGDEAYDSRRNFNILDGKGMEPIIKVRRNAVKRLVGMPRRQALTVQRCGSESWRRKYGLRWIAESAFSWMKRVFGEHVASKKLENLVREIHEGLPIQPVHRNDKNSLKIGEQWEDMDRRRRKTFMQQSMK